MKIEAQCCITSFSTCPAKILIKNEYDIRATHKPYPSYFLNATHNSIAKAIVEFIYCGTNTIHTALTSHKLLAVIAVPNAINILKNVDIPLISELFFNDFN